ncbi:Hint domain-containing protein [Muricoccus radiodurans]|uniref:Hint domain-containing protein n=1 Tax=Muricoccus radiodurans TaxID=2231721 RepID=UPI003CF0F168
MKLSIQSLGTPTVTYNSATNVLTISGSVTTNGQGGTLTFTLNGQTITATTSQVISGGQTNYSFTFNGDRDAIFSDPNSDTILVSDGENGGSLTTAQTSTVTVVCFMAGTLISTTKGDIAVEALCPGDAVLLADGRTLPVRWIGQQTVSKVFAHRLHSRPVRIRAGALGGGLPRRDLLVSPGHAMVIDGVLVEAGALVNGTSIVREENVPDVFTYYHVELDEHAAILAEGAPTESFVDYVTRARFDNGREYLATIGDKVIPEMDLPRALSARQIPAATRRRLQDVAASLLGAERAAA